MAFRVGQYVRVARVEGTNCGDIEGPFLGMVAGDGDDYGYRDGEGWVFVWVRLPDEDRPSWHHFVVDEVDMTPFVEEAG